eukprot:350329-Rhodomonas_salina.1
MFTDSGLDNRYQQYGVGKSLLLVTSDGGDRTLLLRSLTGVGGRGGLGFTWNFIDPQEWFEAEKIRIDREKAEADRERARQLQEQLAEERRQQVLPASHAASELTQNRTREHRIIGHDLMFNDFRRLKVIGVCRCRQCCVVMMILGVPRARSSEPGTHRQ